MANTPVGSPTPAAPPRSSSRPGPPPPRPRRRTPRKRGGNRLLQLAALLGVMLVGTAVVGFLLLRNVTNAPPGAPPTLASNALNVARDVGTFFLESAQRDVGNLMARVREATSGQDEDEDEEAEETDAVEAPIPVEAPPRPRRLSAEERLARLEPLAPSLSVDGVRTAPSLGVEPPLHRVFDETDTDVLPPGTMAIRLRSELLDGWSDEAAEQALMAAVTDPTGAGRQIGIVEVTISERGQVERARLISAPSNVHESMLLSAIKSWQFEPATRNGQAVRYRQVMPVTVAR